MTSRLWRTRQSRQEFLSWLKINIISHSLRPFLPPTRGLPQAEQPHFDPGVLVEDLPGLHQAPLVPLGHVLVSWQRVASTHSLRRSHRSHQIVLQNFPLRLLPDSPDDAVVVDLPVVLLLLTPR